MDTSGVYQDTTMTFDGYGRLKTRHAPEQQVDPNNSSSTDHTTWTYNSDNTTNSVTDARGSYATYSYNNRHLVTSIVYTPSAGVTATVPVTYVYDAAGNRTSMTDAFGSKSYAYNQLSQMTSETRTFNGVGTFTLSYDYNLGGELKTITDPWGAIINYGFDSNGRLNNMTGSGYGNVSQFLSNLQYRAWGTLKSETYGNGVTSSASYNSRLQLTSFAVRDATGQLQMSHTHQYYADGQPQFIHNALGDSFDRGFAYDHAGRTTEVYSGSEARDFINGTNSGEPTGHFRQSYQYNGFNQIAQEINRLWSSTRTTTNAFTNNRREGWSYNAEGEILDSISASYTRDSAGQIVGGRSSYFTPGGSTSASNANNYDGDGRLVKTTFTSRYFSAPPPTTTTTTTTTYYLGSAVMGGLAVAELDTNGQKTKSYIYAGARKLAEAAANTVGWSHEDPLTGSRIGCDSNGICYSQAEFNADGVAVGFYDPIRDAPHPPPAALYAIYTVGSNGGTMCVLDGFPQDCGFVFQLISNHVAQQCPTNGCGPQVIDGKLRPLTTDPNTGRLVYGHWERVDITVNGEKSRGTPYFHIDAVAPIEGGAFITGLDNDRRYSHPQNPATVVANSITEADRLLAKDPCRDFIQNVLGVNNPDGLIPLIKSAALNSYPGAYSSDGPGVHAVATWDNAGNYSIDFYKPFFMESVPKQLESGRMILSGPVPMEDKPRSLKAQGQDTLHEGIHLWTGKKDIELANLFLKSGQKPFTDKLKASEFWHGKLKEKCK